MWERSFRRAGWRLSYSHGFNPHPKISFGAPLPVAVAGDAELLDVYLDECRDPQRAYLDLARQLPSGVKVRSVDEVPVDTTALQKLVKNGEYVIVCPRGVDVEWLRRTADRLLAAESLPRERAKEGKKVRAYDLRPMIRELAVEEGIDGCPVIRMLLRTDAQGAGRPDEVLREMGVDPADCRISRVRLLLAQ